MSTHSKIWYKKYFISYCVIAMIPVLVLGLYLCVSAVGSNRNAAQQEYQRSMVQAASHIDTVLEDMRQNAHDFESNAESFSPDSGTSDASLERLLIQYLTACQQNSKVPVQAMFYRIGDTLLYTADGLKPYDEVKKSLSALVDLDYSNFFTNLVSSVSARSWQMSKWENGRLRGTSLMAFTFPYPAYGAGHLGVFIFLMNINDLKTVIADYLNMPPDFIYLYSVNYQLIGAYEDTPLGADERKAMLAEPINTPADQKIGEKTYVLMRYKTSIFGVQVVCGVDGERMYANVRASLRRTLVLMLASTFVAFILAYLLARYSYRPIRQLMKTVPPSGNLDEFSAIHRHLSGVTADMETMEERSAAVLPIVHDQMMTALLRGKSDGWVTETLRYIYPDFFSAKQYFVILVQPSEVPDGLLHNPFPLTGGAVMLYGVPVEEEGLTAFIAACRDHEDRRTACMAELKETILAGEPGVLLLSAGGQVSSAGDITTSYLEAYVVHRQNLESDGNPFCVYRAMDQTRGVSQKKQKSREAALTMYLQSLQSVDESTALAQLQVLEDALTADNLSFLYLHFSYVEIFSRTLTVIPESVADAFRGEITSLQQISSSELFADVMERLTRDVCRARAQSLEIRRQDSRKQILALMEAHFSEDDFSLANLSRLAGYSATYVNRCLREETGMSFIQMLSGLRMRRAKELLADTDLMVKEITRRIGYLDAASVVRKFKESEGITPSEYRDLRRSGAEH